MRTSFWQKPRLFFLTFFTITIVIILEYLIAFRADAAVLVEPISADQNTGHDLSIAVLKNGQPHVLYVDYKTAVLYGALYDGKKWQSKIIDSQVFGKTSQTVDDKGNLLISYQKNGSTYIAVSTSGGQTFSIPQKAVSGDGGAVVGGQELVFDLEHKLVYLVYTKRQPTGEYYLYWQNGFVYLDQVNWLNIKEEVKENVSDFSAAFRSKSGTVGIVYYSVSKRTLYHSADIYLADNAFCDIFNGRGVLDIAGLDPDLVYDKNGQAEVVSRFQDALLNLSLKYSYSVNDEMTSWIHETVDPLTPLSSYNRGYNAKIMLDEEKGLQKIITFSRDEKAVKYIERTGAGEYRTTELFKTQIQSTELSFYFDPENKIDHLVFQDTRNSVDDMNVAYLISDEIKPKISISGNPSETIWYNNTDQKPLFAVSGTDNGSRQVKSDILVNGVIKAVAIAPESAKVDETSLLNGKNTVKFEVIDGAGNVTSKTFQVKYDEQVPKVTATIDPAKADGENGYYRIAMPKVTLKGEDSHSGIAKLYYSKDGKSYLEVNGKEITLSNFKVGVSRIYYYAVDLAKNKSEIKSLEIKIDPQNPNLKLEVAEGKLQIECQDAVSGCKTIYYSLDGSNPTLKSPIYLGKLSLSKSAKIKAVAYDYAGNKTYQEKEYSASNSNNNNNNNNNNGSGTGGYRCGKDVLPKQKIEEKAFSLRRELEGATTKMPAAGINGDNWGEYVELYCYCDYPIDALLRHHFFKDVVKTDTNWKVYRNTEAYKKSIFKTIPNEKEVIGKNYLSYYAKLRMPLEKEKQAAIDLRAKLEAKYDMSKLQINAHNWAKVVNAYLYGGYSVDDVARVIRYSGKVVHPWMPKFLFEQSADYKEYSIKPVQ